MIIEVAELRIDAQRSAEFEAAIVRGVTTVIANAKGFLGYQVIRGIESPGRVLLQIRWETLENHTLDFRQSPAFEQWRAIVGEFFISPPQVEHFSVVA